MIANLNVHRILFQSDYIKYLVGFVALIFSLLSVTLNLPILIINLKKALKLRNSDINLICLISTLDLTLSIVIIVLESIRLDTRYAIYFNTWFCQVEGFLLAALVHASLYSVAVLSLERYFIIVKKKKLETKYWILVILISTSTTVIFGLLCLAYREFQLMPSGGYCLLYSIHSKRGWFSFIAVLVFILEGVCACSLLSFCYIKIMYCRKHQMDKIIEIQNSSKRKLLMTNSSSNEFSMNKSKDYSCLHVGATREKEAKPVVIYRLFFIIAVYFMCFVPSILCFLYETVTGKTRNIWADAVSVMFISCTNLGNAMVVLVLHRETRDKLKKLLRFN